MGTHPYSSSTSDSENQCFPFSTQFQTYIILIISNDIKSMIAISQNWMEHADRIIAFNRNDSGLLKLYILF